MIRARALTVALSIALCGLLPACGRRADARTNEAENTAKVAAAPRPADGAASTSPGSTSTLAAAAASSDRSALSAPGASGSTPAAPPAQGAAASVEGMVKIPSGIFLMGSPVSRGNPEEQPPHEAIVASFLLDKTEVTLGAYLECSAAGRCLEPRQSDRFCNAKFPDRMDHPVNCIDWRDAKAYCAFAGKRLPLEREWEYAAGAGAEHRTYAWGEEEPSARLACYDHPFGSCAVASFTPGAFGLYDMTGNVWEWTGSAFKAYPSTPTPDEPSAQNLFFVYRGGSWSRRFPKWMRTTLRNRYEPTRLHASLGVRCAKSVEPLECPQETEARDGACVRTQGTPLCEPRYAWNGTECAPLGIDGVPVPTLGSGAPPTGFPAVDLKQMNVPQAGADAAPVGSGEITRSRTPQYDADCVTHWPGTTTAYLYKGGRFHDRRPLLAAAGCSPRDVGSSWTSACCK